MLTFTVGMYIFMLISVFLSVACLLNGHVGVAIYALLFAILLRLNAEG